MTKYQLQFEGALFGKQGFTVETQTISRLFLATTPCDAARRARSIKAGVLAKGSYSGVTEDGIRYPRNFRLIATRSVW